MSEEKEVQEAPEVPDSHEHEPAKQRSGGSGAFLATLLALGALGGSYYLWQQLEVAKRDINAIEQSVDKLLGVMEKRHQEQQERLQHIPKHQHAPLEEQLAATEEKLQRLEASQYELRQQQGQQQTGGLVAEVEYLLRIAQHRLTLEHDTATAISALRTARNRLELQDNPAFAPVIDQIGKDIDTLAAIELPDREALAAEVAGLAATVEAFPLANGANPPTAQNSAKKEQTPIAEDSWKAIWQKVWHDIRGLVTIRHEGEVEQPMLAPEQRYFLRHNLQLKLESARLALLSGHPQAWRDGLEEAADWLKRYFDLTELAVSSAVQTLERLSAVELDPSLPQLAEVRQLLQQAAMQPSPRPEASTPAVEAAPAPAEQSDAIDQSDEEAATKDDTNTAGGTKEQVPDTTAPVPDEGTTPDEPATGEDTAQQEEGVAL